MYMNHWSPNKYFFSPRLPRVRLVQPGRPISIGILWRWKHINTRCGSFWWLAVFNLTRTFQVQNQPPQATPCDALCFEDHHPTVDVYTNDTMAELWNFIRTWYFRMIWLRNKVRRSWKKASTALRIIINIKFVLVCGIVMWFRSRLSNETISRYLSATKRPSSQGQHSKTSRPVEVTWDSQGFWWQSLSSTSSDSRKTVNQLTFAETEDLVVQVLGRNERWWKIETEIIWDLYGCFRK